MQDINENNNLKISNFKKYGRQGQYIYVPKNFIKAVDMGKLMGGFPTRQQYLDHLAKKIPEFNQTKVSQENVKKMRREWIEFDF